MKRFWILSTILVFGIGIYASVDFKSNQKPNIETLAKCYHGTVGDSDSVFTVDSFSGNRVSGSMAFVFAQKDSSYGKYTGTYANGQMKVKYTFWSEGVESVGELEFNKMDEKFKGSGYNYSPATDCDQFLRMDLSNR